MTNNIHVEYHEKEESYRDFWAVTDHSITVPRGPMIFVDQPENYVTVALCDSEAVARRVAELIAGDATLRTLLQEENGAERQ